MINEYDKYFITPQNNRPQYVVSVTPSLSISMQGNYFVGQTETLSVGNGTYAWTGLVNPPHSHINLYANVFTVSNFSNEDLVAEIWLNTNIPDNASVATKVSPSNTSIMPLPMNRVDILYKDSINTNTPPHTGVNVYQRIVPPMTTLVGEEDGKFIEAPGGNYSLVIKSLTSNPAQAVVALGWWEKVKC